MSISHNGAALDESLLGHEDGVASWRWRKETNFRPWRTKVLVTVGSIALIVLIPLTLLFILHLFWNFPVNVQSNRLSSPSSSTQVTGPRRDLRLLLNPEEHTSRDASIRKLSWTVTKGLVAPDGVEKTVFLINNLFPGPVIEARSYDVLEVEILNLSNERIAIHWHGLRMKGANEMDGSVGITQCAINPGRNFTYRIPVDDQTGTFWYHAHSEAQRADGLYGGLVVHNPSVHENLSLEYDKELLLMVGDWYHLPSAEVLAKFQSRTSEGKEPVPDSLLINGMGHFECSMHSHAQSYNCNGIERPSMSLDKSLRYRVRLINVGALTGLSFAIPDAEFNVFEIDGGYPVLSHQANAVGVLYPAERVDLILSWPQKVTDYDTQLNVELDKEYFLRPNFALTPTQSFDLAAQSSRKQAKTEQPGVSRFDLRHAEGYPLSSPLPDAEKTFMIYSAVEILNRLNSIPKGFINHTTWEPGHSPLLSLGRSDWDSHQLVPWTGDKSIWIELTINNIDATGHPFHLHGHDFYVVGSHEANGGWDYYNPFDLSKPPRGGPFNLGNPVRKDTVYVPPWGYVVIRFLADNAGIWALHCHILWHQSSGMVMAFQVQGDEFEAFKTSVSGATAEKSCFI